MKGYQGCFRYLKKSNRHTRKRTKAVFLETAHCEERFLEEGERRLNVCGVLKRLGVSRSGYYACKKRLPSERERRKQNLKERIMEIYQDSHQNDGAPKITECLKQEGERIAEKTVGSYRRERGIKAQSIKPDTRTTTDPNLSSSLKNIRDEKFDPNEPDGVWCTDIPYIGTFEGFVYLTRILDLFSRKSIAWVLCNTLEATWVVKAAEKAKAARNVEKPKIIHSDRGIQYVCREYMEATEGMQRRDAKKAYPWDNAWIESFLVEPV